MNLEMMIELIIIVLILAGIVFSLLSSLGFLRLPDVYTRIHAGAKGTTMGTLLILFSAFIYFLYFHSTVSIRLILGIVFVFLTAPVSGQLIIRAAYRSGVPLANISVKDDLRDELEAQESDTLNDVVSDDANVVDKAADKAADKLDATDAISNDVSDDASNAASNDVSKKSDVTDAGKHKITQSTTRSSTQSVTPSATADATVTTDTTNSADTTDTTDTAGKTVRPVITVTDDDATTELGTVARPDTEISDGGITVADLKENRSKNRDELESTAPDDDE